MIRKHQQIGKPLILNSNNIASGSGSGSGSDFLRQVKATRVSPHHLNRNSFLEKYNRVQQEVKDYCKPRKILHPNLSPAQIDRAKKANLLNNLIEQEYALEAFSTEFL